ncbi:MAG TPA: apolipoprotein N-acyltransferase [Spirochaetota bacterium]|nr:apolipoprotein N-acyltransferase [Spirochaetota bacterium]
MKYTLKLSLFESLLLGLLSGVLMYLSFPNDFPGYHCGLLGFTAFIPLALVYFSQAKKQILGATLAFTITFYYFFLSWISRFDPPGLSFPLIVPLIVMALTVYYFLTALIFKRLSTCFPRHKLWLFPVVFTGLEYLRNLGFLKFPYGILAYTQYKNLPFIQMSDITGYLGVSFIMYFFTGCLADYLLLYVFNKNRLAFFKTKKDYLLNRFSLLVLMTMIILSYGYYKMHEPVQEKKVKISLLQPWWDFNRSYSRANREKVLARMEKLSQRALTGNPDTSLMVWPESAVNTYYQYYIQRVNRIPSIKNKIKTGRYLNERDYRILEAWRYKQLFRKLTAANKKLYLLFGSNGLEKIKQKIKNADKNNKKRISFKQAKTKAAPANRYYYYNRAIMVNNEARMVNSYAKRHLVPFAEWFPYTDYFPWVKKILDKAHASSFRPGQKLTVFKHPDFNFSVLICYDDCFDNICRLFVNRGAEVLIIITNDAWSYSAASEMNHFILSVFRAVENRRAVLRSANAGVTCHINSKGEIVKQAPLFRETYLNVNVKTGSAKTVYSRYGSYPFMVTIAAVLVLLIISFFRKNPLQKKNSPLTITENKNNENT